MPKVQSLNCLWNSLTACEKENAGEFGEFGLTADVKKSGVRFLSKCGLICEIFLIPLTPEGVRRICVAFDYHTF